MVEPPLDLGASGFYVLAAAEPAGGSGAAAEVAEGTQKAAE